MKPEPLRPGCETLTQAAHTGERRDALIVIIEDGRIAVEIQRMRTAMAREPDLAAFGLAIGGCRNLLDPKGDKTVAVAAAKVLAKTEKLPTALDDRTPHP